MIGFLDRRREVHPAVVIAAQWHTLSERDRRKLRRINRNLAAAVEHLGRNGPQLPNVQHVPLLGRAGDGPVTRVVERVMAGSK